MADETSPAREDTTAPRAADATGIAVAGPVRYRVRRAPNIAAFLITGAVLGMLAGFAIDFFGPNGCSEATSGTCTAPYSPGVSLAYFLVLGALAGVAVAATVVVALDKLLDRR